MKNIQPIFSLLIIVSIVFLLSCDENDDPINIEGDVELFLIEKFEKSGSMFQIDESSVITESAPLLTYADFLSYNSSTRTYEISESGILKVKNLSHSTHGIAFAIKADSELVYSGYFWPGYSSMSCDWVTIDPMSIAYSGTCAVRLGYPGATNGVIIPDKRNDPRILDIFRRDNKLIE